MRIKSKRLRVAHLHWGFPPIIGGVETHLEIMLPEMVKRGHAISLLTCSAEGTEAQSIYKGIEIQRTPLMDLNWLYRRGLQGLKEEITKLFSAFIEKNKPDIFHCHNMHYFSPVHIRTLQDMAKKKGIPFILTAHNVWDDMLFLDLTRNIDWTHIIAVSHFIKKELIGVGCDDEKITVIHHGTDIKAFNPGINPAGILRKYPQMKNRKIVFHPARISLAKGCDVSIKALSIIKESFPDVLLVLAGSKNIIDWGDSQQKEIAYLVNLIKHFKLRDNVLIDFYALKDMPQIYSASAVCIYPSSFGEPFGLAMLESLATGKPMIVTNSGGMPEIIRDGINGYVIPTKDFEVLASRINLLFSDARLCRRLGSTGRQMVESYYTKGTVTKGTVEVYRRVL